MKSRKYYKTEEVQKILGVSKHTVWRYIKTGKIKGTKRGKAWLMPVEQFAVPIVAEANTAPSLAEINLSPKQKRILTTLNKRYGKDFANIYQAILFLFQFQPPDWQALLSHEIRELINLIPVVVLEDQLKKREYAKQIISLLQKNIKLIQTLLTSTDNTDRVTLSKEQQGFFKKIAELTDQLIDANSNPEALMESVRTLLSSNPYITTLEKRGVAKNMQLIHDAFGPRTAHHESIQQKNSKLKPPPERYLDILSTLDDLLYGLIAVHRFVGDLNDIDNILKIEKPTNEDAKKLNLMIRLDQEKQSIESKIRYVFSKCKNANWIKKLYELDFFSNPPEIKKEGEYIQIPVWTQSQSLIQIVPVEQEFVLKIINQFQYVKNPRIIEDFLSASLSFNINGIKRVVEIAIQNEWIKILYAHKLPEYLTDLAGKLIIDRHLYQLGWQLADIIFTTQKKSGPRNDVEGLFDEWMYSRLLDQLTKAILPHQPKNTIAFVGKLLNKALQAQTQNYDEKYNEISYIWRNDLWSANIYSKSILNTIITIIMGSLKNILDKNKPDIVSALNELAPFPFQLFRRIEMVFYHKTPKLFRDQIIKTLINENLYFETNTKRELVQLLKSQYKELPPETKDHINQVILDGPARVKDLPPDEQKSKETEDYKKHAMLDYLYPIANQLPKNLFSKYQAWINKFGTPKYEEGIIKSFVGPTSPQNADQLDKMSVNELADYLISWTPIGGFTDPSAEGLGRELSIIIKKNPEQKQELGLKLLKNKARFEYFYHYFWGLEQALKEGKAFDWDIIINIALDLANLENASAFPKPDERMEAGLDAVLQHIASLISEGLSNKSHPIPFQLREKVWNIINTVTEHKDPTPEYEKQYGGDNIDPHNMSINTTRGEGFHALFKYALWCNQGLFGDIHKSKVIDRLVPEVKKKLERHLDPTYDPSVTIRSVYGLYFPQLTYLNKEWLLKNIEKIFPQEDKYKHLWSAAFQTFLINRLYQDTFKIMYDNYCLAIKRARGSEEEMEKQERTLAHHIALGYAYNFYKSDELLEKVIQHGPSVLQKEIIWFCGSNIIKKELKEFSKDAGIELPRLKKLWIDYANNNILNENILEPFGWWFANSPFDRKQTISLYSKILQKTEGKTDPIHQVIPELKNYAKGFPELTINIIKLLVQGIPYFNDRVSFYADELMEVMDIVKKTGVERAVKIADDLIDEFVKSGYEQFRKLT